MISDRFRLDAWNISCFSTFAQLTNIFLTPRASTTDFQLSFLPALILLTFILIAVLLTALVVYVTGNSRAYCTSPACDAFAHLLHASINSSFSPCDDFGHFVCQRWRQSHRYSVNEEYYRAALETMSRLIKEVKVPPKGQNALQQMAAYYRSCYDLHSAERDDTALVKAWLLEAGVTWPARPANPSVLHTLAYLSLMLRWPSVLKISVKAAGANRVIIFLAPSFQVNAVNTGRMSRLERLKYFGLLRNAFAPDATTLVQALFTFEEVERVEETMLGDLINARSERQLTDLFEGALHRSAAEWNMTISKFQNTGSEVTFQTAYPRFVETFTLLWRTHGEDKMHLFVSWHAVRSAGHFAHESLVSPEAADRRNPKGFFYRGIYCLVPLYVTMGDLAFALYNAFVWPVEVRLDVKALVMSVRDSFVRLLSANSNFAPGLHALSSWSSVSFVFSVLDYGVENRGLAETPVVGLPDLSDVFARNYIVVQRAFAMTGQTVRGHLRPLTLVRARLFEINSEARDFVLVPFALTHPLYDAGATAAVKYGGLGSHVAMASARILLDLYEGKHAENNSTARQHLRAFRKCLEADVAATFTTPDRKVAEELIALDALLNAFSHAEKVDKRRLEGLPDFSSTQMFFVAWCFMRCTASQQSAKDEEVDPCSPTLRHVGMFSEAFRCGPNARLNPERRCRLL
ncbi:hypothetical protein V5799_015818 [Amblyomma americanum]|uniref:Uncharacterized protein n=1 Tax=Amblyomma americanum TaxID=6943 RepID=A0AAQ4F891_AMBAM